MRLNDDQLLEIMIEICKKIATTKKITPKIYQQSKIVFGEVYLREIEGLLASPIKKKIRNQR